MGATIHFKIKYHGLNFSSDYLDGFYKITSTRYNVTLGKDCEKYLPPYTEFTSKDFPSLQQNIDDRKLSFLSDIKVLYFRDLGANQQTWASHQVNAKISTKSFEEADNHTFNVLSRGTTNNAGYGAWINFPSGYNDIILNNVTDIYVILVIDSDPQSDSWYYPSILYCSNDYYSADTKVFSNGKPDMCVKWLNIGFKGIFYPTKNRLNIQTGMTDNSAKDVYINNFDTKQGKYISCTKYTTPVVLPSDYTDYPNIKHVLSFQKLYDGEPSTPPKPVTEHPNAGKSFLRIMYEKNTLNTPLLAEGFYTNNVWSDTNYNFISGPIYDLTNLKEFQDKSDLTIYQPSNTFDNSDKYNLPRITSYYHVDNDKGVVDENSFYGGGNLKGYNYSNPTNGVPHTNGATVPLSNQYLDLNYMSTYNTVVVGNDHALSQSPTKDELIFYPYLTFNLPNEALTNYSIKILNTDSSSHPIDSFHNHGLVGGRKYTIEITNNNKKDYTSNPIYFVNNTDQTYLKLTDDYTFTADINHQYIITSRKPLFDEYNVYNLPTNIDKKTKIIIDFLHDKETDVYLMSNDTGGGGLRWATLATNPINYDVTGGKGEQVHLATSPKPDSTKYVTTNDTIYNIYYFANGKPDDLDINNYSLDYLNKNATTKYVTNPKSNGASPTGTTGKFEPDFNLKYRELFSTPASFTKYGYYLILPVELKDYYGVILDNKGNVAQKVYVNRENKVEKKNRPAFIDTFIGYYDNQYDEIGVDLIGYYRYHSKDYGITTKSFIDPNRYDNFICLPFDLINNDPGIGELPAFELAPKMLANPKIDLGGYYNLTTHKIDPITIKENTDTGSSTSGSTTGGSSQTGGSSGSSSSGTTGGSTGGSTSGSSQTGGSSGSSSSGTTGDSTSGSSQTGGSSGSSSSGTTTPITPTNLNNQIHLYSINQQNIIDLSTKDLSYQTSLSGFASYDANNFINQVYILPFGLPTDLKENVSDIVTGLFKLDTDTIAIKQDHYDLDLGSITIKPKYNNGFDYNVTKCTLHLPFTNLINLDINDILNKTISIKYKVSLLNADTTVNILSDEKLIFTGKINIGTDLQLFSINSNNIAGLLNSVLQNDVLIPYITITRNKPINNLVSYETNEHNQLSNYTGFVQTNNSSVSCGTQEEQQEIESLLNGGIYIK